MTGQTSPFDDIRQLAKSVPNPDLAAAEALRDRAKTLGRGLDPLGTLVDPLARISAVQGTEQPRLARPLVAVFTGSHKVADGSQAGAKQRVVSLSDGEASVRGIAQHAGSAFKVFEFGLDFPADDFREGPSLSERDCAAAIAFGMEVVAEGAELVVLGNAGFGSATGAAAIARGLYGGASNYWAGGHGEDGQARCDAVKLGSQANADLLSDPLHILRAFGGRDLAGAVGAILACAHQNVPVILDGYVVCAAAAVVHAIAPDAVAHCLAGHVSVEPAHAALLDRLDMEPILSQSIGIGDGTGGALALSLLQAANAGLNTLSPI
jgi:nicotinate-nucleotide--dimethylbenzimidazole phosphoribosyltransferase